MGSPLYIGFDLSTQQLKGLVVNSDLKVVHTSLFDFDADSHGFDIKKGVQANEAEHEVFAPVALWLQALDGVLEGLRKQGLDFSRVKGISGAGQQHGSVYWGMDAEKMLKRLDANKTLQEQLDAAFSHPFSPNWQDASTQRECDEIDQLLGGREELADVTGSKAHHVCFLSQGQGCYLRFLLTRIALHGPSNPPVPEKIPRGVSPDCSDLPGVFVPGVGAAGPYCAVGYLGCVWHEPVAYQGGQV